MPFIVELTDGSRCRPRRVGLLVRALSVITVGAGFDRPVSVQVDPGSGVGDLANRCDCPAWVVCDLVRLVVCRDRVRLGGALKEGQCAGGLSTRYVVCFRYNRLLHGRVFVEEGSSSMSGGVLAWLVVNRVANVAGTVVVAWVGGRVDDVAPLLSTFALLELLELFELVSSSSSDCCTGRVGLLELILEGRSDAVAVAELKKVSKANVDLIAQLNVESQNATCREDELSVVQSEVQGLKKIVANKDRKLRD
eukprot:g65683.t1